MTPQDTRTLLSFAHMVFAGSTALETTAIELLAVFPVRAESIIGLTFVGILQDLVGFIDFLELFFRARFGIDIGMIPARKLAVSLFDVTFVGVTGDVQNLVVVLEFHSFGS